MSKSSIIVIVVFYFLLDTRINHFFKNSKYFDFAYEEGKVTISLSEEAAKLKPGNYTISYKVYFEGAAYNVAPVTMKFTATVK